MKKLTDYVADESSLCLLSSWYLEHEGRVVIEEKTVDIEVPVEVRNNIAKLLCSSWSLT